MLRKWHRSIRKKKDRKTRSREKPMGFIAVSIGDGLNEIFRELGAGLYHRRRTDHEPKYRRYAECDR